MNRLSINVKDITLVLQHYDLLKVYRSSTESGIYTEITTVSTRIPLRLESEVYFYDDLDGDDTKWYKTSYYNSATMDESDQSTARPGGSSTLKIGYSFGNYSAPPGDWGKVYTADDIRYTMLFGVDCVGSDIARTEFTDEQFDFLVDEAVGEFEGYLKMDIRRRVYKTFVKESSDGHVRSRHWRSGIDYTDEDEPYDFDPQEWSQYGFVQLRHYPVIRVTRAVWLTPVQGEIMDMIANKWIRVDKSFGQVRMFPTGGFTYGPYSVYGPLWSGVGSRRYPGAFEFDYETGYESADFVPDGLRSAIGKYATIKALAVVGDGLLAGFSSQSVSLDGLSESFSSTQSATSAYFGARIAQYTKEIDSWLQRNRYTYSPVGISFVGSR